MTEIAKFFVALILAMFLMLFAGRAIKEMDGEQERERNKV
jgi:hypothetical protein